ncbi:hypothetical protein CAC42_6272 [Sphaceloma murrayae]|uniref:Major facilitator superfamily (MFS) profile domain-containing protein n=1 Tax=Sphaceloma murrayae TaxID=2082308 RepID=A0A2K1QTS5_9PEZI|nr:hypothetical protein CAC42_6272 [Sphaceloma murrayae]
MSSQFPTINGDGNGNGHVHVHEHDIVNETTPLIAAENAGPTTQANAEAVLAKEPNVNGVAVAGPSEDDDDDRPLPKTQILILCYARMVEPIAFFSIFPFVNAMIYRTASVPEADVGFYSGLIESLFSLTQMSTMILWGRVSDRYGRRPVIIISTIGIAIGMTLFGFATSVWQMVLFRCMAGVFSGSLVAIRAMFSELSTRKTQARAFSFFAVAGNLGIFAGPFIGGGLAEPVEQYPGLFGGNKLFERFPYGLATMVSGAFAFSAAALCTFGLKETLPGKGKGAAKPMSMMDMVKSPGVGWVLFIYSWTTLVALGWTAVAPVFWFTSPGLGGYGLSPIQISMFLAISGASQALWTLLVFPPFQRRVATGGVLRTCFAYQPFLFILMPVSSILRRNGKEVQFWVLALFTAWAGSSGSMAFTGIQLALNDISPSHQTLGTLNALALTLVSGIRAVAPASFASLYAFGVGHQILGGYLIFAIIIFLSILASLWVRWLPDKAYGTPVKQKPVDAEDSQR